MVPKSKNIFWHEGDITKEDRERLNGHRGVCLWFTGLSGSGKSSIAQEVQNLLYEQGVHTYVLDGDNIRHGLNSDLGFSPEDRNENIRRIGEVSKEIYVEADLETCEKRDPKGLYKKARAGEIKEFTGISAPYEPPLNPELVINTSKETDVRKNAKKVVDYLEKKGYLWKN